ncbi:hypothetical protein [Cellulosilyticum lentocellum]|uniref:hypothetical protein n=1 Tax=Cellulosilyticum lentocellum TaxID=29360 RepID=UPI00138AC938|nr:hypothetical protein [Cellulosilyticum lentocellum]
MRNLWKVSKSKRLCVNVKQTETCLGVYGELRLEENEGEDYLPEFRFKFFRGTRLTYLDERMKTPAGQTLMLKPIQNVRQVPLKNSPKSLFQAAFSLIFTNVIELINIHDIEAAWEEGVTTNHVNSN